MKNMIPKRSVSLLVILAMLTVAVAMTLPVTTSADPTDFSHAGVQTLSGSSLLDETTSLRFVFQIESLAYDEVGFVFSKTNVTPTVGGDGCFKKEVTTVYRSIIADGNTIDAEDGHYWVAVKMNNVPREYFGEPIYVCPYVDDGIEIRYDSVGVVNICREHGEEWKYTTSTKTSHSVTTLLSTVKGDKHFYPSTDQGGAGQNDLIIEFSFLWNDTLPGLNAGDKDMVLYGSIGQDAYWMSLTANAHGSVDGAYAGGFENIALRTVDYGPAGMVVGNGDYDDYPNIGGSDEAHPEYGWHRLAIVFHEEVLKTSGVSNGGSGDVVNASSYRISSTCYIDGVQVYTLSNRSDGAFAASTFRNGQLLFTTNQSDAPFTYTEMTDRTVVGLEIPVQKTSSGNAYAAYADYSLTVGTTFVQQVKKVASPTAATYKTADGTDIVGTFWYEIDD